MNSCQSCFGFGVESDVTSDGRRGEQCLAGSRDGGVTRPAHGMGVKQSLTYASCEPDSGVAFQEPCQDMYIG